MAGPIRISILANASQANREIKGVQGQLSKFGSGLKRAVGFGLATAGFAGITEGIKSVVSAASDSQQSLGATQAIYGKYAKSVIQNSNRAAKAVGLSANTYRENSNLLGALLKNQGVAQDKLAGKTKNLIKLGADLSAQYGGTATEAVQALTSAFKGEFDPLERYGVSLKASIVSTEAFRVAHVKTMTDFKALSPAMQTQARQQATTNLLLKQSADATGAFARETDTLQHKQQVLAAQVDNVKAKIGKALLPILTDLAQWASDKVVPALQDFATWLNKNKGQISDTADSIKNSFLPPLKTLADLVGSLVRFFVGLPDPVKKFGAEAALAAFAFGKLTGAVNGFVGSSKTMIKNLTTAESRTKSLGNAMRQAGGVGGMLLLAHGTTQANKGLKSIAETAAGGALTGFAVGGPVGAGFGFVAGEALGLYQAIKSLPPVTMKATTQTLNFKDALQQANGKISDQIKQMILLSAQTEGVSTLANRMGISQRDLIGAVRGNVGATKRLNEAYAKHSDLLNGAEQGKFDHWLRTNTQSLAQQRGEVIQDMYTLKSWKQVLKGLPTKLQTQIKQLGAETSMRKVRQLAHQYDISPKKLLTKIELAGINVTGKTLKQLRSELKDTGNTKPGDQWIRFFVGDLDKGKTSAKKGGNSIADALVNPLKAARPNLNPFKSSFDANVNGLKSSASTGGHTIGGNLGSGINQGITGWISTIAQTAARAVNNAEAAARAAADSHSPSKVFARVGSDIGAGLNLGLRKSGGSTRNEGKHLIQALLKGITSGTSGVNKVLDRIRGLVRGTIKGKDDEKREKAFLRHYKAEFSQLLKNAKAQDLINKRLDDARSKLKDLQQARSDYAKSVKDSAISFASVTNLDSAFNPQAIVASLKAQLDKLTTFANLISQLKAAGLNQTTLDQLVQGGVEGSLAYAQAIAAGGVDAVGQINALQTQIGAVAGQLGDTAASSMYDAGVKAAAGIVKGLEKAAAQIDRAAIRLANRLVEAVKRALGIHSPSRVFQGLGDNVIKGLQIGLDDTYVKRSGQVLAASLQKGFGEPALQAVASSSRASGASGNTYQITVNVPVGANRAQTGREIVQAIRAYEVAGGRR